MKRNKRYYTAGYETCHSCGNKHHWCWLVTKKIGCASSFYFNEKLDAYQIYCSYGSWFDGDSFLLRDNTIKPRRHMNALERLMVRLEHYDSPSICDKCLARFLKKKQIYSDRYSNV